jgi:O-acetyl-ADP-ribose deacetylase (regulator of RNase III)
MKDQLVNDLLKYFLDEADKDNIEIPDNYVNKRTLLTGLINQRPAKPISEDVLKEEDILLKEEYDDKKVIDVNEIDGKIILLNSDITLLKVEAIVNPCDERMLGCFTPNHNCIDNQVHTNAGIRLRLKCSEIMRGDLLGNGKVVLTDAYNLPSKYIIHTVGPEIDGEVTEDNIANLKACYQNALEIAKNNNIKEIAFPCISTGRHSFPSKLACEIAIKTVKDFIKKEDVFDKIVFSTFTLENYAIYDEELKRNNMI